MPRPATTPHVGQEIFPSTRHRHAQRNVSEYVSARVCESEILAGFASSEQRERRVRGHGGSTWHRQNKDSDAPCNSVALRVGGGYRAMPFFTAKRKRFEERSESLHQMQANGVCLPSTGDDPLCSWTTQPSYPHGSQLKMLQKCFACHQIIPNRLTVSL